MNLLINTNAKNIPLADGSVHCVVTSPPYYGLRDYGTAKWQGGDTECDHVEQYTNPQVSACSGGITNKRPDLESVQTASQNGRKQYRNKCAKCGAVRIDQQIGLEQTPAEYVNDIVQVFREVWRVLRDDGTVWLNLGDSYNGSGGAGGDYTEGGLKEGQPKYPGRHINNLKPKDLIGIPWMVAFALRADGWYLRQDIIWHKPNPMPESVKDRCTKSHEYIFLLSKSAKYYYDNEAVKEPVSDVSMKRAEYGWNCDRPSTKNGSMGGDGIHTEKMGARFVDPAGRNKRDVWTVTTKPYKGAHYATFPPELITPCILAGAPETCCAKCGAPYERVTERVSLGKRYSTGKSKEKNESGLVTGFSGYDDGSSSPVFKTIGFEPTCTCNAGTKAGIVFDPFVGSGTTVMVANHLGRKGIGLDLNFKYLKDNAKERIATVQPIMFN